MENARTWCVRSTMRTSGMMEYITPRQMATESSNTPKSVMKTIVGGYFCATSLAGAVMSMFDSNASASANRNVRRNQRFRIRGKRIIRKPVHPHAWKVVLMECRLEYRGVADSVHC